MVTMAAMVRNTCAGADRYVVLRKSVRWVIAALACMSVGAQAAEWKVTPRISLEETYTDNVALVPSNAAKSDWITQVTPGVSIEGKGDRLRLNADYALQNLVYANDSSRDNFYHQLNASVNATLVENTLFMDAKGNIQQQATSLLGPVSQGNLNTSNISDVSSYSLSPYLLHKFGSSAVGELRFTHDSVNTQVGGLSDSSANKVDLKLNSGPSFYDLGWGLSYTHEKTNYDLRQDTDSKVFTGTASYRVFPKLRAIATAGYEKNNFIYLAGQEPRGSFWSAGLSWTPTTQTNVDASVGERFFGKTYAFGLNHRTAQSTWVANYSQNITSMRQDFLNPLTQEWANFFQATVVHASDKSPLTSQEALELAKMFMSDVLGQPNLVLTNQYYLSKQLLGSASIKRGKSLVTLTAMHSVRESVETTTFGPASFSAVNNVKQYGLSAQWAMQISPRDTFNLGAGLTRNVFPYLSRTDDTSFVKLGVSRKLEKKVTGSVDFFHTLRNSNFNENDYTQNAVSGHLMWMF